jgi:hypothetical protein
VLCSLLLLACPREKRLEVSQPTTSYEPMIRRAVAVGVVVAVLSILADYKIVRAIYGNKFAGYAGLNIRFGPNKTTEPQPQPRAKRGRGKAANPGAGRRPGPL